MFRLPKSAANQSPTKKVVGTPQKGQGLCKYPHRKCSLTSLENYNYCLKHILEDKTAPYKPCPFLYTVSGKKCGKPAYRLDRKDTWFCAEHTRKTQLIRQKASSRHAPPQTQEALLASLGHYAVSGQSSATSVKQEETESDNSAAQKISKAVNPFVDVDAAQMNTRSSQVLDYASDSDSDAEAAMLEGVWRAQDNESSDAESVDSQAEDPLKHAGTYTAEEVTTVFKDKMIRLQSLYIDQFRRLHYLLKERRRKYLHALKKEKETMCSVHDQEKMTVKEQKLYQKLKALNHFHKYFGEEAILHKKALEKRAQVTESTVPRTSHKGKCVFTEGGVKCGVKTLPGTKYCRKHIFQDTQQVLYRACGVSRDDHVCQEPTLNVFENATCVYHIKMPAQPHNALEQCNVKEEEKSESVSQSSRGEAAVETLIVPEKTLGEHSVQGDILKQSEPDLPPIEAVMPLDSTTSQDSNVKEETLTRSENNYTDLEKAVIEQPQATSTPPVLESVTENTSEIKPGNIGVKSDATEEKMEVCSTKEEQSKPEGSGEDLVMVDMMTDVGVVEEVLESEAKPESEESMEVGQENNGESSVND